MKKIMKIFYGFLFRRRLLFAFFFSLSVVSAALFSINPYFYKLFVDALPSLDFDRLLFILAVYMAVRIIAHGLSMVSFMMGDAILIRSSAEARAHVFKYIQQLDLAFHSSKSVGSLLSAFKRGDAAFFTLFHVIHFRLVEVVVSVIVMLVFFSALDVRIALMVLASFVVTLAATKFLIQNNVSKRARFNEEEDNISSIIGDNMINYETVKLFSRENWEFSRLNRAFASWREVLWSYGQSFRLIDLSLAVIINLSIFIVLYTSLRMAVDVQITLGEFVMITGFISIFFPKLWELVWNFRDIAKNYIDLEKYFALLGHEIQVKDPQNPLTPRQVRGEIEFNKVYFSYKGRFKNAINGVSLKIKPGQSVALVGRSGSGKTTFVRLLMRFYDTNKGRITLDSIDVKDMNKSTLRSFLGVVPQEPILFNHTIAFNIGYAKASASMKEIRSAAKLANIDKFIDGLPEKYRTVVGERGVKLSGGQKQRLAIARMILSNPKVIIFDEATSQLDSESEKLIQGALWKAAENRTTIIIAHRLSTVMKADKIVVMENGKIKETGSHKQLLARKDSLYHHFWNLQIKLE